MDQTAISRPASADLIPGYRLEKLVGKGGMGEVHKATQLSLGRTVAVKLLAAELAKDSIFVNRFEKEGAALAALSHPNIVSIVDKGHTASTYYLVMEFVDGPSLREVMRSPLLDQAAAVKIILEICRAIDYAHNRGVIHRDLKPENILFDEQAGGIAKVSDFGLAGFAGEGVSAKFNLTETHVSMGTVSYMAPEQRVDAKTADHRADVYSLGVIIYELLVGEVPIGNFDPPSQRKPELDKRLDAIIARCLRPNPQERYQKVSELIAELEPMLPVVTSQLPVRAGPLERFRRNLESALRKALKIAASLVVLLAVVVVAAALVRANGKDERQSPGVELTTDFGAKWPLTAVGRVDGPGETERKLVLGSGPDTIPLVALGRKPELSEGSITFGPPEDDALAGRLLVDADVEGKGLSFRAEVTTELPRERAFAALRELLFGPPPEPRSALLLLGETGRYVALVVSGREAPPTLEWALGAEKRGTMTGSVNLGPGASRLELAIDKDSGELSAYVGEGKDRRLVGDRIGLGRDWKKLFGGMPKPAVGCLDGACGFKQLRFAALKDPPPPPPPPPEPPPPPKKDPKGKKTPPKGTGKKPGGGKKR